MGRLHVGADVGPAHARATDVAAARGELVEFPVCRPRAACRVVTAGRARSGQRASLRVEPAPGTAGDRPDAGCPAAADAYPASPG